MFARGIHSSKSFPPHHPHSNNLYSQRSSSQKAPQAKNKQNTPPTIWEVRAACEKMEKVISNMGEVLLLLWVFSTFSSDL